MADEVPNESQDRPTLKLDSPQDPDITEAVRNSPLLSILVEEVRIEQATFPLGYNRMHNRHNRSR